AEGSGADSEDHGACLLLKGRHGARQFIKNGTRGRADEYDLLREAQGKGKGKNTDVMGELT
ncbi:MAG: hypothetical protein ACREJN_09240, partial [Nitrospiraceae bacterium]